MLSMARLSMVLAALALVTEARQRGVSRRQIKFRPPFKSMNPREYDNIFDNFKTCTKACVKQPKYDSCNNDAWTGFGTLGAYTACITKCVASEVLNTVGYYKSTYGLIYDVYAHHLEQTKKYLAGAEDFDFIGNRSRIDYSCVLPDEYFVPWKKVAIEAFAFFEPEDKSFNVKTKLNNNGIPVTVRADKYLEYCSRVWSENPHLDDWDRNYLDDATGFGGLKLYCDNGLFYYLQILKGNLGHQILHPDYRHQVPNGACTKRTNCDVKLKPNPEGECFQGSVCVVQKTHIVNATGCAIDSDDRYSYLTDLIVTKPTAKGECEKVKLLWNNDKDYWLQLDMFKVDGGDVDLFKVKGLPRYDGKQCDFKGALGYNDINNINALSVAWVWDPLDWVCSEWYQWIDFYTKDPKDDKKALYHGGGVEYSNAKQYANHLTRELFDYTQCPFYDFQLDQVKTIKDAYQNDAAEGNALRTLYNLVEFNPGYSIACLYRIVTLKCDCMRAVVNCYENENQYTTAIGQTLGRASSILCGFILCQQPVIYRMFADADGARHAVIMQEILLQTNLLDEVHGPSVASLAFVSFGLGMIAFVAAKHLARGKSTMEDGYRNLI